MRRTPENTLTGQALDAWRDFARDLRMKGCSANTITIYGDTLAQLAGWLADRGGPADLLDATRDDLTGYLTWVRETHTPICRARGGRCGGHVGSQKTRHAGLRRFWNYLAAEEWAKVNVMARVPLPMGETKVVASVRDEEISALLKACAGKDHNSLRDTAIIQLWMEVGSPRASEIARLLDEGVDLAHDLVLIDGKGRKQRWVVLSPETARAFSRYRRARGRRRDAGQHREFFLGLRGPMTSRGIANMLDRRARQAGLSHKHPHMFRHAASVSGRRAGLPDTVIAHMNGWSTTRMMERYGREAERELAIETTRTAQLGGRLARVAG